MRPHPWTPPVLPLQLLRIGSFVLVALPAEITTMAARRLMSTVADALPDAGHLVVAAYANAYAGYVTTREEYAAQHYEGASTLFGPYTLNAYQQEFHRLAVAMREGRHPQGGDRPADLRNEQKIIQPGVWLDMPPLFGSYGDVAEQPAEYCAAGEWVRAEFWSAHPKNDYRTQSTFLEVQHFCDGGWVPVRRDLDPDTLFEWRRVFPVMSKVRISWFVGPGTPEGTYRLVHFGCSKSGKQFSGATRSFTLR
jgi:neutral ceramidase